MSEVPLYPSIPPNGGLQWDFSNDPEVDNPYALRYAVAYRGTSLTKKRTPLGPYRRPMPRVLGGS